MNKGNNINIEQDKIQNVLKVPTGYFNSLENEVLGKTIGHSQKKKLNPWIARISIAASIVFFAGLYLVLVQHTQEKVSLANITPTEILEQSDMEITQEDFISLVSLEDLNKLQQEIRENTINLDNEEIEDYNNDEI